MTSYIIDKNKVSVVRGGSLNVKNKLPVGTYIMCISQDDGIYLEKTTEFKMPKKMYGDVSEKTEHILKTFDSRCGNLGVLLEGTKGTGKTLLAKNISNEMIKKDISVILVNQAFPPSLFNRFLDSIDSPVVLLFDEFEKTHNNNGDINEQTPILTLLDGVFNSKKLFLFTCNDAYRIDNHMKNRPGRIFYHLSFDGMSDEEARQYCEDNLKNQKYTEEILSVKSISGEFTFDILKAIVEELNLHGKELLKAIDILNVDILESSRGQRFIVQLFDKGNKEIQADFTEDSFNPLKGHYFEFETPDDKPIVDGHVHTKDIIKYDKKKGIVEYQLEEYRVVCTPKKEEKFDLSNLIY